MVRVRSRLVRRGRTGRKVNTLRVARRRVQVHRHYHRRYAGVATGNHHAPNRPHKPRKPRINKTGHHHRFFGRKKHLGPRAAKGHGIHRPLKGRHGHRHFHGRKKSLHKRHMRKGLHRHFKGRHLKHKRHVRQGLHRHFKGRKYHGRHVKPGHHRRFFGRKTTHHKGHFRAPKPKPAPISAASYLSMF